MVHDSVKRGAAKAKEMAPTQFWHIMNILASSDRNLTENEMHEAMRPHLGKRNPIYTDWAGRLSELVDMTLIELHENDGINIKRNRVVTWSLTSAGRAFMEYDMATFRAKTRELYNIRDACVKSVAAQREELRMRSKQDAREKCAIHAQIILADW